MSRLSCITGLLHCLVAAGAAINGHSECASSHGQQFATITTYSSARDYLQCQRDSSQLARVFDSQASLEAKHKKLIKQQCEPRVFIMVGRHAARSPDEGEMKQFNGDLAQLVNLIRHTRHLRGPKTGDINPSDLRPLEPEYELEKFELASNNLLTGVGLREQQRLAARLKLIYPQFFNASESHIHLGTTSKLRTAQTATEFARSFDNFDLGRECAKTFEPTMACYKHVLDAHSKIELEYHKVCKKQIKEAKRRAQVGSDSVASADPLTQPEIAPKIFEKIAKLKSNLLDKLVEKVSRKLALAKENSPTRRHIESAYNVCRYELAARSTSVWCDLFDSIDMEALDYLDDANIYHKISARLESNKLQACPIVREVVEQLASASEVGGPREAHFGFTHVGVLKKILAVFGMFEPNQGDGYTETDLDAFERAYASDQVAQNRQWRTSLMVPFSANVNFVLYKCAGGESKILTTISEQPVRVRGCSDSACPVSEFLAAYGHMRSCDPGRVCAEVAKGLGEASDE